MTKKKKMIIAAVAVVLIAGGLKVALGSRQTEPTGTPVTTGTVVRQDLEEVLKQKATLEGTESAEMVSKLHYEVKQVLVKEGDKKPIIINIGDELMELKIKSQIGSMNEEIMITKEGKDLLIGFNPKFLIDALRVIDDEEVTIYLMNAKAPCFIKDDAESYVYLILPVNFNSAA